MGRQIREMRMTYRDHLREKPFRRFSQARDRENHPRGGEAYDRWQMLCRLVLVWVYRDNAFDAPPFLLWLLAPVPAIPPGIFTPLTEDDIAVVRLPFSDPEAALVEAIARTWAPTLERRTHIELGRWARAQQPRMTKHEAKLKLVRCALEFFRETRPDRDPQFVQNRQRVDRRRTWLQAARNA